MSSNDTMIRVSTTTREKLGAIGRKNQTYDDIINELIANKKEACA